MLLVRTPFSDRPLWLNFVALQADTKLKAHQLESAKAVAEVAEKEAKEEEQQIREDQKKAAAVEADAEVPSAPLCCPLTMV